MKKNPLIVIIDEDDVFDVMTPVLLREFYQPEIMHLSSQQEAIDFIHSEVKADIIFADWHLVNEESFLFQTREDIENHNTPVVLMTEGDHEAILNSALKYGITQHLTKPFLDKALVKQINKITSFQEGRRKRRLHPDKHHKLDVEFSEQGNETLDLIDLSSEGCLLRSSVERAKSAFIYHEAIVNINLLQYQFALQAEVSRIGHDYPLTEMKENVLIMLKFTESNSQTLGQLNDLLDDLQSQWEY